MRLIDADALFDETFKAWGTEADGSETNSFMEMINNAPTIAPPPNDPLTMEQLREMDGEPVWVISLDGQSEPCWMLVDAEYELCREAHGGLAIFDTYGKTWLAYRHKPEEIQHEGLD